MSAAKIFLVDSFKLGDFYFTQDAKALANKYLAEGLYTEVATIECFKETAEEAAEDMFDLTNNPGRQSARRVYYGNGRSVSVGDIVQFAGEMLVCRPNGWVQL